jgi:Ulp1 family protease
MILVHQYNTQIQNSQFYLNDTVINDYMKLIVAPNQDIYAFDTYFYCRYSTGGYKTVQRWTKKVNIFSKSKLLIPINLIQPK